MECGRGNNVVWSSVAGLRVASLVLWAWLGLACGTTSNAQFCDETRPCPAGQECTENECVDIVQDIDAAAVCPTATHECIAGAPADWLGPMLRAEAGNEEAFAACAAAEDSRVGGGSFEPGGSCECSCTTASSLSCTNAVMQEISSLSTLACLQTCAFGTCVTQQLSQGSCTIIMSGLRNNVGVKMSNGTITGGQCHAGMLAPITPAAEFQDMVAMCPSQAIEGECSEAEACTPNVPEGFDQQRCIYRAGEHECPEQSPYTVKSTSFASLSDGRSCESCECNLPAAGSRCSGSVRSCDVAGIEQTGGCVASVVWGAVEKFEYVSNPSGVTCTPANAAPALLGEVAGVDPTTICCTEPEAE